MTARLDLLDEHPCFAAPSGLADDTQAFSPERPASPLTPLCLRGHNPTFKAILSSPDQFLEQHSTQEEPAESSNSSTLAGIGMRLAFPDEPVENFHDEKEPPMSYEHIGDIKVKGYKG